jgi:hypothetical protein
LKVQPNRCCAGQDDARGSIVPKKSPCRLWCWHSVSNPAARSCRPSFPSVASVANRISILTMSGGAKQTGFHRSGHWPHTGPVRPTPAVRMRRTNQFAWAEQIRLWSAVRQPSGIESDSDQRRTIPTATGCMDRQGDSLTESAPSINQDQMGPGGSSSGINRADNAAFMGIRPTSNSSRSPTVTSTLRRRCRLPLPIRLL